MIKYFKYLLKTKSLIVITILIVILSTSLLLSYQTTDTVLKTIYFYSARPFFSILNTTKIALEKQFISYNKIFKGVPSKEITYTMPAPDNRTFKIKKFGNLRAVTGYDYTIVIWVKKETDTTYKRALELSAKKSSKKYKLRTVLDYLMTTEQVTASEIKNISALAEFDKSNNSAKIYISHCTPSNSYVPPFMAMYSTYGYNTLSLNGVFCWPSSTSDVGYIHTGTVVNGFTISSLAGYTFKVNGNINLSEDISNITANLIPNGANDLKTTIDETLATYNLPLGTGFGSYLGKVWITGKQLQENNLPRIYASSSPEYQSFYVEQSEIANINMNSMTGKEVYDLCKSISINPVANYPFDNLDELGDVPNF